MRPGFRDHRISRPGERPSRPCIPAVLAGSLQVASGGGTAFGADAPSDDPGRTGSQGVYGMKGMKRRLRSFGRSIRHKVLLGIVLSLVGVGTLGAVSYYYLRQLEETLALAEGVDDLQSDVLEIRRSEKNYLLYGLGADRVESLRYVDQAISRARGLLRRKPGAELPGGTLGSGRARLTGLLVRMEAYRDGFRALGSPHDPRAENVRMLGKELVADTQLLVGRLRGHILEIVSALRRQLVFSTAALLGVGLFLAWLMGRRILHALGLIEKATTRVVKGDFSPLPLEGAEAESRHVLEALNHMICELESRQNQLVQEKKLASLGVLTAGIAHQLNNPLNNIFTSCQLLRESGAHGGDAGFPEEMLRNIHQEVLRARDIVRGLLDFARQSDFSLKPVSLADVVGRAVALVAGETPPGLRIDVDVPPADGRRLQEVCINLLLNAIQAVSRLPGRISVTARRDELAAQAVLRVRDSGDGIPEAGLGRIFDPFFTLKGVGKGTGLGLSVAFGIIRRHGGTISVESREGEGSCFTVRLPLGAHKGE